MTLTKKELIDALMQSDAPDDTPVWKSIGFGRNVIELVEIKTEYGYGYTYILVD